MDPDLQKRIDEIEKKLDAIYKSAEKTRKYFLWTLIAGVVGFILPLIGLAFALPAYLSTLQQYTHF